MARLLETRVEELFRLAPDAPGAPRAIKVEVLPGGGAVAPGQPVRLCPVGKSMMAVPAPPVPAYFPTADGVLLKGGKTAALSAPGAPAGSVLIAGCDPALSILAAHATRAGVEVALAASNSSQALRLLRDGRIHVAGTHLPDEATGESNVHAVRKAFPRGGVNVVTFASWQQGLVVARGNPKKIRNAADLVRPDVSIVNREPGAGARMLLDLELRKAGVEPDAVDGYERIAGGHFAAAFYVVCGLADCCVATEAAARALGLGFLPIRSERFDLVIPAGMAGSRRMEKLLDVMQSSQFRRDLEVLAGYDTGETGRVIQP